MSQLAQLAADPAASDAQRAGYQSEYAQLGASIGAAAGKEFNGVSLFSGNGTEVPMDSQNSMLNLPGVNLGAATYTDAINASLTSASGAQDAILKVNSALSQLSQDRRQHQLQPVPTDLRGRSARGGQGKSQRRRIGHPGHGCRRGRADTIRPAEHPVATGRRDARAGQRDAAKRSAVVAMNNVPAFCVPSKGRDRWLLPRAGRHPSARPVILDALRSVDDG